METKPKSTATPSSHWHTNGEPDPHAGHYDGERAQLTLGKYTDDELANGVYMNYDVRPPLQDIVDGKAHSPIAWVTAAKDRIRWLSRKLEEATAALDAAPIGIPCFDNVNNAVEVAILTEAHQLGIKAQSLGLVLTIDTVPQTPLAMGNYHMRSSVRPKRAAAAAKLKEASTCS